MEYLFNGWGNRDRIRMVPRHDLRRVARRALAAAWNAVCLLCGVAATCSLALVAKAVYVELL